MRLHLLALAVAATPSVFAADWYVDPVGGDDSSGGTSPADAWRTITRAMGQIPVGTHTLHLLPGTYGTASGELLPIDLRHGVDLVGDAGLAATILEGAPTLDVFRAVPPDGAALSSRLSGITIHGGQRGVQVTAVGLFTAGYPDLVLEDMRFDGCRWGVTVDLQNFQLTNNRIHLERVEMVDCVQAGFLLFAEDVSDPVVTAIDCTIQRCETGMEIGAGIETVGYLNMFRCRLLDNAREGLLITHTSSGQIQTEIEDSLFARNRRGITTEWHGRIRRTTIANNNEWGLRFQAGPFSSNLRESVLHGNGDDLDVAVPSNLPVANSNIGDGDYDGMSGNISVDPLFRDPDHGDYRLGFGTGCVDAIPGGGVLDLTGFERGNDGDLDLSGARDMGALELRTLDAPQAIGIGQKLHIDVHAEPGAFTTLWLARGFQLPVPDPTPFGERWLPRNLLELAGMEKVPTHEPVRRTVVIPDAPVLIGRPFSFQALSRSSNSATGAAWTDAVTVIVTP